MLVGKDSLDAIGIPLAGDRILLGDTAFLAAGKT